MAALAPRLGALLGILLLASPLAAQVAGMPMPRPKLEGLSQSKAENIGELEGRALLLEFFAHW